MLTANEARDMMPDKDTVIYENVQSICNDIQILAQKGYSRIYIDYDVRYLEETLAKLKELGFTIRKDGLTFAEW